MLYTTNAIESLNARRAQATRNKGSFPDDASIYKIMYLAIRNATKKWSSPSPTGRMGEISLPSCLGTRATFSHKLQTQTKKMAANSSEFI